jgi:hypothetical protein
MGEGTSLDSFALEHDIRLHDPLRCLYIVEAPLQCSPYLLVWSSIELPSCRVIIHLPKFPFFQSKLETLKSPVNLNNYNSHG